MWIYDVPPDAQLSVKRGGSSLGLIAWAPRQIVSGSGCGQRTRWRPTLGASGRAWGNRSCNEGIPMGPTGRPRRVSPVGG